MARKTKAQKKFKAGVGCRVVMTRRGRYCLKDGRTRDYGPGVTSGILVGFDRSGMCVKVLRDGYKTFQCYHIDFWKPVQNLLYLSYDPTGYYKLWEGQPQYYGLHRAYYPSNTGRLIASFCAGPFEQVTGLNYKRYGYHCRRVTVGVKEI